MDGLKNVTTTRTATRGLLSSDENKPPTKCKKRCFQVFSTSASSFYDNNHCIISDVSINTGSQPQHLKRTALHTQNLFNNRRLLLLLAMTTIPSTRFSVTASKSTASTSFTQNRYRTKIANFSHHVATSINNDNGAVNRHKNYVNQTILENSKILHNSLIDTNVNRNGNNQTNRTMKQKKRKKSKSNMLKRSETISSQQQKQKYQKPRSVGEMAAIRRIQSEWRDIVQSGLAFDWVAGKPIIKQQQRRVMKKKNRQKSHSDNDNTSSSKRNSNSITNTQQQSKKQISNYMWIGPLSKQYWYIWHFSFIGVSGSVYENGIYHGRIVINPLTYPGSPPSIQILTNSGRYVPYTSICLDIASNYHPELWQPNVWTLRSIIDALRLNMLSSSHGIGSINYVPYDTKIQYANDSRTYRLQLSLSSSSIPSIVTIDHRQMIECGWFTGITIRNNELEQESTHPEYDSDIQSAAATPQIGDMDTNDNNIKSTAADSNDKNNNENDKHVQNLDKDDSKKFEISELSSKHKVVSSKDKLKMKRKKKKNKKKVKTLIVQKKSGSVSVSDNLINKATLATRTSTIAPNTCPVQRPISQPAHIVSHGFRNKKVQISKNNEQQQQSQPQPQPQPQLSCQPIMLSKSLIDCTSAADVTKMKSTSEIIMKPQINIVESFVYNVALDNSYLLRRFLSLLLLGKCHNEINME